MWRAFFAHEGQSMKMKSAIVIGTGAGGATMARALQGRYQVTMLEAGRGFRPFSLPLSAWPRCGARAFSWTNA